jgi:hypothetical protein
MHLLEVHLRQEEVLMEMRLQVALIVQATLLPEHQEVVQVEVVQQEVHLLEVHLHQVHLLEVRLHQEALHLLVEEEITKILFN